jgi:DNA-directed RNA polymerase specialized sigma24 family protein
MKRRQRRDLSYLENVIGTEPDPSFAAQIQDEFQLLLSRLADDGLRAIALSKLEGFSNEEIAEQLNCSLRTITRRLTLIRRTWEASADFADN